MAATAQAEKAATTVATPAQTQDEVMYSVNEFASAAEAVFGKGTSPDTVRAALRVAGLTQATKTQAKKLVTAFAKKEVVK